MSTNMIVTSTCSPARFVPSSRMCSATSGSMPNASQIRSRSANPCTMALKPSWRRPIWVPS